MIQNQRILKWERAPEDQISQLLCDFVSFPVHNKPSSPSEMQRLRSVWEVGLLSFSSHFSASHVTAMHKSLNIWLTLSEPLVDLEQNI